MAYVEALQKFGVADKEADTIEAGHARLKVAASQLSNQVGAIKTNRAGGQLGGSLVAYLKKHEGKREEHFSI